MSQKSETPNQQNISEVLEMLKHSYNTEDLQSYEEPETNSSKELSFEELKERLGMQFSDQTDENPKVYEDIYNFDQDFLIEAEENLALEESSEAYREAEVLEEVEALEEEEEFEEAEELEEIEEFEEEEEIEEAQEIEGNDEEIVFDENELPPDDTQKIVNQPEPQNTDFDDDFTFDQIEEIEDAEEEIVFMRLELEPLENPIPEAQELMDSIRIDTPQEEKAQRIPEKSIMREFKPQSVEKTELEQPLQNKNDSEDENGAEELVDADFLEELVADKTLDSEVIEEAAAIEADSSEISLLMQFGCDDEIIDRFNKSSEATKTNREAVAKKENERERFSSLKEKVFSNEAEYKAKINLLYIRLALCSLLTILLLLYEGLPTIGIELSGILNRDDYYISYVLIGLQLVVLCVLTSYKQIWEGAKKLLTSRPCAYSVAFILCVSTLLYDISILFVSDEVPHTYHFALACALIIAIIGELKTLTAQRNCFEFCFDDVFAADNSKNSKHFTLRKSYGKNSTAEKMYSGGLDTSHNIYYPIEIKDLEKFFKATSRESSKNVIPMILLIPMVALSLLTGILAIIVSGEFWIGMGGMTVCMFMALPTVSAIAIWLPFERISATAYRDGYTFAGEGCMEAYANADVAVFSDLHIFEKCSPQRVNLALYDATAKETLLGCLNALYSKIGGPMENTFCAAENKKLGECRITRVSKSGVEAIVGNNYSVLLGKEGFMSRYGISFPQATLNNKEDEVFTLCVSINGRATARIAVRYSVNKVFEMFAERLAKEGIYCAIETFDPIISTELLGRVNSEIAPNISFIHLGVDDINIRQDKEREEILFDAAGEDLGVIARGSRFNLSVALSTAKKMKTLRKYANILSMSVCFVGMIISLAAAGFGWVSGFSVFFIILYWILSGASLLTLIFRLIPDKNSFSFERYQAEKNLEEISKINK